MNIKNRFLTKGDATIQVSCHSVLQCDTASQENAFRSIVWPLVLCSLHSSELLSPGPHNLLGSVYCYLHTIYHPLLHPVPVGQDSEPNLRSTGQLLSQCFSTVALMLEHATDESVRTFRNGTRHQYFLKLPRWFQRAAKRGHLVLFFNSLTLLWGAPEVLCFTADTSNMFEYRSDCGNYIKAFRANRHSGGKCLRLFFVAILTAVFNTLTP